MTIIVVRPVTAADNEFCFQLHKAAMGDYVRAIWGWNEHAQREYHRQGFLPNQWQIITADGEDIGALSVQYHPSEIYLGRIEVLPQHQSHGVGSQILRDLLDQAAARGQSVVLDVLTVNHRAQALYQRLGFVEITRHGPGQIRIRMKATPSSTHKP